MCILLQVNLAEWLANAMSKFGHPVKRTIWRHARTKVCRGLFDVCWEVGKLIVG
jgi:hypothetical protein